MTLEDMLMRVPARYDDFVPGALMLSKRFGAEDALKRYLTENPEVSTSDVYLFLFDYCALEPLLIVPDDKA